MVIKKIGANEREAALDLALSVFMQYEAPDYSEQGIKSFTDFINANKEANDFLEIYGAYKDDAIIGVIATRNNDNHIALLFVEGKYHNQGIGRNLFDTIVLQKARGDKITVNSSPFAVGFYKKMGFIPDSEEQIADGIRFTPMTYLHKRSKQ